MPALQSKRKRISDSFRVNGAENGNRWEDSEIEQKLQILGEDERYLGVLKVKVPSIYPYKGSPIPKRMGRLVKEAAYSLKEVYEGVVAAGGHLYISDMFRSAREQQKAHEDYKSGRKTAYSPPACSSVHEAGRAIDIDAFDTLIGHKKVRDILNRNGWTNIVDTLTGAECWHYEYRGKWEKFRKQRAKQLGNSQAYREMVRMMKEEIGNKAGIGISNRIENEVLWLQESLNKILECRLKVDRIMGPKTRAKIREFQAKYKLQVDGIAGPITKNKIKEILSEEK